MKNYRFMGAPRVLALAFAVVLSLLSGSTRADALFSYLGTNLVVTPRLTRYHVLDYDSLYLGSVGATLTTTNSYEAGSVLTAKWVIGFLLNDDGINWKQIVKSAVVVQARETYMKYGPVDTNCFGRVVQPGIPSVGAPQLGQIVLEAYPLEVAFDEYDIPYQLFLATAQVPVTKAIPTGAELTVSISFEVDHTDDNGKLGDLGIVDLGCSPTDGAAGPIGVSYYFGIGQLTSASEEHSYAFPMSELSIQGLPVTEELKLSVHLDGREIVISWPLETKEVTLQCTDNLTTGKWTNCLVPVGASEYRAPLGTISGCTVFRGVLTH